MLKNKKTILVILLVAVFWKFILPGSRVANDFPLISLTGLKNWFDFPRLWTDSGAVGMGEYSVAILWGWPLHFLYGLGGKFGLDFAVLERLLGVIPFILIGIYSFNKLLEYLKVKGWGRFVGSLFYLINTYILLVIDGGQFNIALAYAWFPLAYLLIIKSLDNYISSKLIAGLGVAILGFFDIRFVYVLFLLLFFKFIFELIFIDYKRWHLEIIEWVKSGLVLGIVFAGLHAYWILPAVLAKAPQLPAGYGDVSQTSFLSFATLGHALLLLQPHWYKNVFGKVISLQPQFYLIPILVFLAPVLHRAINSNQKAKSKEQRAKTIGFWLVVALIGVFLVKGSLEPWEAFYPWLFQNIPGFSMFRDPTKFFFLVAISYSVLIGFTSSLLLKKFNWELEIGNWKISFIPLLLTTYFILLIYPVWTGKMTGTFSEPYNKDEFFNAAEEIKQDDEFGRVLWIPSRPPLGYASPTHPTLEASRLVQLRPFAIGTVGTYEVFNFLREAPFMGELMDIAGVKYIGYPYPDERREDLKEDNIEYYHAFLEQLSGLPWIEEKISDFPVPVLKTKEAQDHFFIADNTIAVIGSDRIYNELVNIDEFELANNALVFVEEKPALLSGHEEFSDFAFIAYDKKEVDINLSSHGSGRFIFPASILNYSPIESGWWKRDSDDLISWRNFLQQKYGIDNLDFYYGGGLAVSEGTNQIEISRHWFNKEDIVFARVMKSSKGGKIYFNQGEKLIGEIDTKIEDSVKVQTILTGYGEIPDQVFEYDKADFEWFKIGKLRENNIPITITTDGEINVVNVIAVIPELIWSNSENLKMPKYMDRITIWEDLTNIQKEELFARKQNPTITYTRFNPTHYRVEVEGLTKPSTLVFSETYDSLWRMSVADSKAGTRTPYPVYSLVNGFMIDKDGEYDIYYSAQKYVYPGLIISVLILLGSLTIILMKRKK